MLVLFLNELSSEQGALELNQARSRALELLYLLRQARKQQQKIALNSHSSLKDTLVDQRYSLFELLAGNNDYRDEWRFLRGFVNRSPMAANVEKSFDLNRQEVEYLYEEQQASALGWADIMGTAVVSFPNSLFTQPLVETIRLELDENGDLNEKNIQVRNISSIEHVEHHAQWLKDYVFTISLEQLWQDRRELFPCIRFLPRVEGDLKQLFNLHAQVIHRLQELNHDIAKWQATQDVWPEFSSKASPESETRKRFCKIIDQDELHDFDWHLRFTGNIAGRVHFRICMQKREVVVAYLGQKLTKPIVQ